MQLTVGRLVWRSVWFHRWVTLAVVLGVAAATAVVSGALLVGDSMRGSLRGLTLERLGEIDAAVLPGGFFDPQRLTAELPASVDTAGIILFGRAAVEAPRTAPDETGPETDSLRRAGNVQAIACGPEFWEFGTAGVRPDPLPSGEAVALNAAAAEELGVGVGDLVTVRLPAEQAVPADSPLGRRESESEGLPRLEVVAIVPDEGLGRFSLQPSQSKPLTVFLPLELVQDALDRPGAANVLLIDSGADEDPAAVEMVSEQLRPALADYGLRVQRIRQTFGGDPLQEGPPQEIFDYYSLTSDRLLLSDTVVDAVRQSLGADNATPVLTYLANAIEPLDAADDTPLDAPGGEAAAASIPYSTITAIDSSESLPLDFTLPGSSTASSAGDASGESASGEPVPLVLNSWAAERLGVEPGDRLRIAYFEPETEGGRERERTFAAVLTSIVPITEPATPYRRRRPAEFDNPPTRYNDPDLTPTVPGVTDQDSISDWDLPFRLEREISRADDDYWNQYRLTPKAFLPLAVGRKYFGSRFGQTTSLRIDRSVAASVEELEQRIAEALRSRQAELGFAAIPIKAQQLAASRGTTPFDALFLSLSLFVIVAALMLVALLFRLGMEQRASEYGALLAVGMPSRRVARTALGEGILIAVPGAILGVAAGIGYAMLVLWSLRSWFVGAVTVPFLNFHWSTLSLVGGFAAGVLMTILTILLTTRRLRGAQVRPMLMGRLPEGRRRGASGRVLNWSAPLCFLAALGLGIAATQLGGPARGGAFVGGGMLLLCGVLATVYSRLSHWQVGSRRREVGSNYTLGTLAWRSIGRNPLRSTLSIGLMAVACFLIVSMSVFQMRPTAAGVGGFDLLGQTAVPLYRDLGDPAVRGDLLGRDGEAAASAKIFGLRWRPGQDASCNNLYQASQPQVLGVPPALDQWYAGAAAPVPFEWAAAGGQPGAAAATPWALLEQPARGTVDDPVPVILDQNTALWSLQMRGGVGEVRGFVFDDGRERYFRVVALLSNSVLQGSLLVGEANFERLFPEINGYSFFLIRAGEEADPARLTEILENRLGDVGMDVVSSRAVLARLLEVQNTYLRTFQSLGALGLLLGTFGLAVVQLRNVLERKSELSLLRAVGFSRGRLASSVMTENAVLLVVGIGCGVGAALATVIPYFVAGGEWPAVVEPLWMLAIVLVVGLLASLLSVRRVLRMPLLANL
ncbi:ABC transporter permease [Candidatus Laterigemmans baculatus]|uniref:ABC transporter permease n=1 Tax=Candidatus Laterigemmans baculatus TaxID=2770505 RepID=UPI0013DCA37C|nr:ABC transporter permease [Candidatus Laterigemmans baculatus]